VERAAEALGQWLGSIFEWSEEEREIAAFSLTLIFWSVFFLTLLILLSLLFGVVTEAVAMVFTSGLLRTFAGGAHLSSGWRCGVVLAVIATAVALGAHYAAPLIAPDLGYALAAATLALAVGVTTVMAKYAPVDVPEKPITSDGQRRRLRTVSIVIPLAWGCAAVIALLAVGPGAELAGTTLGAAWVASSIGLLWETLTVVPPGIRFVCWLDGQLGRIALSK